MFPVRFVHQQRKSIEQFELKSKFEINFKVNRKDLQIY